MAFDGETISRGVVDHTINPNVSPIKVLQSAAGYYIGTTFFDEELGYACPNTRESAIYYRTQQEAQSALDSDTYPRR